MPTWSEYKGWHITGHHQLGWPPYEPFVAYAKRERNGFVEMFNVEGKTEDDAIKRVKAAVDSRNAH